jgi:hypothetical protein
LRGASSRRDCLCLTLGDEEQVCQRGLALRIGRSRKASIARTMPSGLYSRTIGTEGDGIGSVSLCALESLHSAWAIRRRSSLASLSDRALLLPLRSAHVGAIERNLMDQL